MLQPLVPSGLGTYRFINPGLTAMEARPLSSLGNRGSFFKRSCIICCIWQAKCILCSSNKVITSPCQVQPILSGNNIHFTVLVPALKLLCLFNNWLRNCTIWVLSKCIIILYLIPFPIFKWKREFIIGYTLIRKNLL